VQIGRLSNAGSATRSSTKTTSSRQSMSLARGPPDLVLCKRKAFVDIVHGHEFLFSTTPVGTRHGHEINGLAIFAECALAITLVVAEAILDADNDPEAGVRQGGNKDK
jgi:hypothetical protein